MTTAEQQGYSQHHLETNMCAFEKSSVTCSGFSQLMASCSKPRLFGHTPPMPDTHRPSAPSQMVKLSPSGMLTRIRQPGGREESEGEGRLSVPVLPSVTHTHTPLQEMLEKILALLFLIYLAPLECLSKPIRAFLVEEESLD